MQKLTSRLSLQESNTIEIRNLPETCLSGKGLAEVVGGTVGGGGGGALVVGGGGGGGDRVVGGGGAVAR